MYFRAGSQAHYCDNSRGYKEGVVGAHAKAIGAYKSTRLNPLSIREASKNSAQKKSGALRQMTTRYPDDFFS
jgi:hypothetical protein